MKQIIVVISLMLCGKVDAQIPIIGTIIAKVIKAIDLKVQRMQNEVLVLQNVQRNIENNLHKLKLAEIADWSQQQKKLYEDYFAELRVVKKSIADKARVKTMMDQQLALAGNYQTILKTANANFNASDGQEIKKRCDILLQKSLSALDQAQLVLADRNTAMGDEARLSLLDNAFDTMNRSALEMEKLKQLVGQETARRKGEKDGTETMKKIYGLP